MKNDGTRQKGQVKELMVFEGLGKEKMKHEVGCGEIVALMGLENFDIGDTVADAENPEGLATFKVDEPTMSMLFTINTSPFFGREGQFVTSRHLRDRLFKEIEKNLAMRVKETDSSGQADGLRSRHPAPEHSGGDHAPRGLRVPAGPAPGAVQGDRWRAP